jgi:hypothetical protein
VIKTEEGSITSNTATIETNTPEGIVVTASGNATIQKAGSMHFLRGFSIKRYYRKKNKPQNQKVDHISKGSNTSL